jgi:WD40 repeat protein
LLMIFKGLNGLTFLILVFVNISFGQQPKLMLPIGHTSNITIACFSQGDKKIVTSSWDNTTKIWDVQSGMLLIDLKNHAVDVHNSFLSPDGKKMVTVAEDSLVEIWDIKRGELLTKLKGHANRVFTACFSADGNRIVTSEDSTAKIWDAKSGLLLTCIKGHTGDVYTACFFPDGKKIATTSEDSTAKIWDAESGALVANLKEVESVYISPDNKKVATIAFDDSIVKIWDALRWITLADLKGHADKVNSAYFSPDSKKITTSSNDSTAKIWDSGNGALLGDLKGHTDVVNKARFSPDSKKIVTTSYDYTAKIWDVETGLLLTSLEGHDYSVVNAFFSIDGKKIVTASLDYLGKIWDAQNGALINNLKGDNQSTRTAFFSPDSKKIVTASFNDSVKIWDAEKGMLLVDLKADDQSTQTAFFSPGGKKIVTVPFNGSVKIWDAEKGMLLVDLKGHIGFIDNACFSPNGKTLLTASGGKAQIWDTGDGTLLGELIDSAYADANETYAKGIELAIFSPGGNEIVTQARDCTVKIWDTQSRSLLNSLKGCNGRISSSGFSPDGKKMLTISPNISTVKILNLQSGMILAELKNNTGYIHSVCFSPDGKKVLTVSDHTAKVWDAEKGVLQYTFIAVGNNDYMIVDNFNHYDGTEAARKLLYFTCGTEIIELDQVKDQLWVPGLAKRINNGEMINAKSLDELNICGLTPEIENVSNNTDEYYFQIKPRRGGLGETILSINGTPTKTYKPEQLKKNNSVYELMVKKQELSNYFIAGTINLVTVKTYTSDNSISSRGIRITEDKTKEAAIPPNLYAVMVGISDYKGDELDLKFAAKDATDISAAVSNIAKKLLNTGDGKEHVFMYNLTTAKEHYQLPEKNSIKKILEEIGKKATANDILLIFFAGHGVVEGDKKQFYFLTADASYASATDAIADVGVSTVELTEWMKPQNIKAQKRILIFDACNSGQAIKDFVKMGKDDQGYLAARSDDKVQQIKAIDKLNEKSGLFILSASASKQSAYEMGRYSQGLLTYSLLKAIKQQPDILSEGKYLDVSRWFNAAKETVSELSKESGDWQEPQIVTNTNFNIGIVDKEVMSKIILPEEKPLFAASNFQNSDEAADGDNLELSKFINLQLNEISSTGADNKIVYVGANNFSDALTLSGRYDVKGNEITVRISLKKNNETKYRFEVKGLKESLNGLAGSIVAKVVEWCNKNR